MPPLEVKLEKAGHYVTVHLFIRGQKGTIGNTL